MRTSPRFAVALSLFVFACDEPHPKPTPAPSASAPPVAAPSTPPPPLAQPGRVVVRSASPTDGPFGVAATRCLDGERLVGGGCGGGCARVANSAPQGFTAEDTRGAGWACKCDALMGGQMATAYALCEGIASPRATADSGAAAAATRP